MLTKRELRALWRSHGFRPIKRLGQNFLIDKNIRDKILRNLELGAEDTVLEIGAGFGELTAGLASIAKEVFAVEKDKKICEILTTALELPRNVSLIEGDFLEADVKALTGGRKALVYGNIPYYATSPIIQKLFDNIPLIKSIYLVVQKEVAERILAEPPSRNMSRLGLYAQYHAEPKRVFNIGKSAFYPAPKIDSVFLKFNVRGEKRVRVKDEKKLFGIIKKAYGQKRKTILNSLSQKGKGKEKLSEILKSAGLNPLSRAEELSLEDFARLSELL